MDALWLLMLIPWLFSGWLGGKLMKREWKQRGWKWSLNDESLARVLMVTSGPVFLIVELLVSVLNLLVGRFNQGKRSDKGPKRSWF